MSVAVRAYIRRTHLGHGQSLRKPGAYSFVESVIDRALFKTLREYFLSEYLRGLPADDEEVYRAREAKSLREASELACRLARESGVGCIVVEDERNGLPRPVFYHGNAVYVTGYFGSRRDWEAGMAHPTIFILDRPADARTARMIGRRLGHLADEDYLEDAVVADVEDCVSSGECEVDVVIEGDDVRVKGVRSLA